MENVTVVIPTYNNASLLDRTLAAVAAQVVKRPRSWSVVVVNNNCTDATAEVVAAHAARRTIPRLTRVREPQQGLSHARQRGVREARGAWVLFIDDDIVELAPGFIQEVADFGRSHPRAGTIGAKIHLVWEHQPPPLSIECQEGLARVDFGDEPQRFPIAGRTHVVGAALAVRRRAILDTGWLDGAILPDRRGSLLTSGGDMELALRIRAAGYELWYNPRLRAGHFVPRRRHEPGLPVPPVPRPRPLRRPVGRAGPGRGGAPSTLGRRGTQYPAGTRYPGSAGHPVPRVAVAGMEGAEVVPPGALPGATLRGAAAPRCAPAAVAGRKAAGSALRGRRRTPERLGTVVARDPQLPGPVNNQYLEKDLRPKTMDLTLLTCTCNGSRTLPLVLEAFAKQRRRDACFEVLVVDNASTDGTAELAGALIERLGLPGRVVRDERPGKINAFLTGVCIAEAPLISVIDDDNVICDEFVERAVAWFRRCRTWEFSPAAISRR